MQVPTLSQALTPKPVEFLLPHQWTQDSFKASVIATTQTKPKDTKLIPSANPAGMQYHAMD